MPSVRKLHPRHVRAPRSKCAVCTAQVGKTPFTSPSAALVDKVFPDEQSHMPQRGPSPRRPRGRGRSWRTGCKWQHAVHRAPLCAKAEIRRAALLRREEPLLAKAAHDRQAALRERGAPLLQGAGALAVAVRVPPASNPLARDATAPLARSIEGLLVCFHPHQLRQLRRLHCGECGLAGRPTGRLARRRAATAVAPHMQGQRGAPGTHA
mmetsp:Transcript_97586/g.191616  ORF Transcript_97586/g.191616 Transcript_97586/m.191616 type:complete len:209 (+) Transcript_97586:112-738(+)